MQGFFFLPTPDIAKKNRAITGSVFLNSSNDQPFHHRHYPATTFDQHPEISFNSSNI